MWMPAAVRRKIFRYFFENGIIVVQNNQAGTHEELDCLNIYVYQIGRSFVSKGLCKKQYAWTHAYFTLNDKGIEYLRNYFGLPVDAQPLTCQPRDAQPSIIQRERGNRRGGRGGRGGFGRPEHGSFRGGRRPRGGRGAPQGERAQEEQQPQEAQPATE
ncbi:hypothetical protein M9Y10_014256 [Tritrichomonas musculus]|uniref:Plectin/eS10 N-terminal domain-containing protein n=1 Tax=Tritrichomonas musculus TaxID=1915356 RepID=A0ABR2KZU5_9EUKA